MIISLLLLSLAVIVASQDMEPQEVRTSISSNLYLSSSINQQQGRELIPSRLFNKIPESSGKIYIFVMYVNEID